MKVFLKTISKTFSRYLLWYVTWATQILPFSVYMNTLGHDFLLTYECFYQNLFLLSEDTLKKTFRKVLLKAQHWKLRQDWKLKSENFSSSVSIITNFYRRNSKSNDAHEHHATPFALPFHSNRDIFSFGCLPTYFSRYSIPYVHLKQDMNSESLTAAVFLKKGFISKKYHSRKKWFLKINYSFDNLRIKSFYIQIFSGRYFKSPFSFQIRENVN